MTNFEKINAIIAKVNDSSVKSAKGFSFRRLLAAISFAGFLASVAVHLLSCLEINVTRFVPYVWSLQSGVFVLFILTAAAAAREFKYRGGINKTYWQKFYAPMPGWTKYLINALCVYVVISTALFIYQAGQTPEAPDVVNGNYVVRGAKAKILRQISEEEYDRRYSAIVRGFSGHWLIFYLIPALYFGYHRKESGQFE